MGISANHQRIVMYLMETATGIIICYRDMMSLGQEEQKNTIFCGDVCWNEKLTLKNKYHKNNLKKSMDKVKKDNSRNRVKGLVSSGTSSSPIFIGYCADRNYPKRKQMEVVY